MLAPKRKYVSFAPNMESFGRHLQFIYKVTDVENVPTLSVAIIDESR